MDGGTDWVAVGRTGLRTEGYLKLVSTGWNGNEPMPEHQPPRADGPNRPPSKWSARWTAAGAISQPRLYISASRSLHWTLDVTFREDQCRVRKDHGPQNLATLRQISHNLLKNENTLKVGIQGKRQRRLA